MLLICIPNFVSIKCYSVFNKKKKNSSYTNNFKIQKFEIENFIDEKIIDI